MALDDMAAEPATGSHCSFEVDHVSGLQSAQDAAVHRLGDDVDREGRTVMGHESHAHSVDRDGWTRYGVAGYQRAAQRDHGRFRTALDGDDLAVQLNNSSDHQRPSRPVVAIVARILMSGPIVVTS